MAEVEDELNLSCRQMLKPWGLCRGCRRSWFSLQTFQVSTSGPSSEIDRASQDTEAANNRSPNRQRKKTPAMPARNGQEDQPQEETVMSLLKESLSQRQTQLKIPSSGGSCEKLAPRCPTSTTEFTEEEHDFWTHQTMTRLRWSSCCKEAFSGDGAQEKGRSEAHVECCA